MTKKDEVIHSGHFMIANVHDGPDASAVSIILYSFLCKGFSDFLVKLLLFGSTLR